MDKQDRIKMDRIRRYGCYAVDNNAAAAADSGVFVSWSGLGGSCDPVIIM
jgi:hypothetical protein